VAEAERGAADGEREREMTEPKGVGNFDSDGALSDMELAVRGDGRERTVSERWMPANSCDGSSSAVK
jgi:hypothetical protein